MLIFLIQNFSTSEENFWRNYFYRVNLISQASESTKINYQESLESQPEDSGDGG